MTKKGQLYIHIGYPKALSTSLQRGFYEKHTDINFLGVGINDNVSYANKSIEYLNETLLKYSCNQHFKDSFPAVKDEITESISTDKINVLSNEHLSFKFDLSQIDSFEKLQRLKTVFNNQEIHIILIHRSFDSHIKSIYKEYIKMGLCEDYNNFIKWVWNFRDRNFLSDLKINNKVLALKNIFGKENVHLLEFETLVNSSNEFYINDVLSKTLGISNQNISINNKYPSLEDNITYSILQHNINNPRGMGARGIRSFENHRNRVWFERSDATIENSELYLNVVKKQEALAHAKTDNTDHSNNLFQLNELEAVVFEKIIKFLD